ncbi:hypothetical protein AAFF39_06820 [Lactococcus garvieae]
MTRYMATIAYDGTNFAGFQTQNNQRTVQEEIEKVLTKLNSYQTVILHGSGRTDSGFMRMLNVFISTCKGSEMRNVYALLWTRKPHQILPSTKSYKLKRTFMSALTSMKKFMSIFRK